MDIPVEAVIGGASVIGGTVIMFNKLGWISFGKKEAGNGVAALKDEVKAIKQQVRYSDTCEAMHHATDGELKSIKVDLKVLDDKVEHMGIGIATLLERTKNL